MTQEVAVEYTILLKQIASASPEKLVGGFLSLTGKEEEDVVNALESYKSLNKKSIKAELEASIALAEQKLAELESQP